MSLKMKCKKKKTFNAGCTNFCTHHILVSAFCKKIATRSSCYLPKIASHGDLVGDDSNVVIWLVPSTEDSNAVIW